MSTYQRTIRTESAGISTARQSLDNVLSAKAHLEQTSSPQHSADKYCALEFQIAELEGMLTEIVDERFARTIDESQPDDENQNLGLLNLIIDTADSILASLLPTRNTPPPTYQKNRINTRDPSFPVPHDQRNSKRRRSLHTLFKRKSKVSNANHPTSTNAAFPPTRSVPAKSTNNSRLVESSKPSSLSNPFRKSQEGSQDSTIYDLSLSAFNALKESDAFKVLLNHTENEQINDIDRDKLWFSFREAFGNNLSKELLCAFDVLIRVSSFERSSTDATNSGRANPDERAPGFNDKGKTPLRSTSSSVPPTTGTPSPSKSIDSDFVTIDSPENTQPPPPPQHNNNPNKSNTTSSQPPPYTQHITKTPSSCINCGLTLIGIDNRDCDRVVLKVHDCGHAFCEDCAERLVGEYRHDESFQSVRCCCDGCVRKVDIERFIESREK